MRIVLLIFSCLILTTVSGQSTTDSIKSYVPIIYSERLKVFVDSLKRQILADTIRFNEADLIYTASGRSNSQPYSKLFLVNGRYLYKLDIVPAKDVVDFTNEILDNKKIKSVTVIDSAKASPLFGPNTWNGIVVITMFDKAKFNPKVAGLTMIRKRQGDNFTRRKKGELLIRN